MKNLPSTLPVFPLSGVIYFPKTNLPLNIFEQRYLNLVNDAYKRDKLMGMVQSKKELSLIHISEPTRQAESRMPSSA